MATRGFEFAYMLDGSNATPVIRDFILSTAAAHKVGDLMVVESDGDLTQAAATATEVAAVCMEAVAAAAITAGTTKAKCAILTRNQVWRCSTDADHTTWVIGYTKGGDIIDCNTLDHDNVDHGPCCCVDNAACLDEDGYQVNYVCFLDTTFGNT
jgi:hypothetical protein